MNPYDTLGVAPDATEQEISEAYRAKAKAAHPDAGGDRAEFEAIANAALILRDPERRKRYDETGQADAAAHNNPDNLAWQEITRILEAIIKQSGEDEDINPCTVDIASIIRKELQEVIAKAETILANLKRAHRQCGRMARRFKRKNKGANRLNLILEAQMRSIEDAQRHHASRIAPHKRALELMADYDFDVEKKPPPEPMANVLNAQSVYDAYAQIHMNSPFRR